MIDIGVSKNGATTKIIPTSQFPIVSPVGDVPGKNLPAMRRFQLSNRTISWSPMGKYPCANLAPYEATLGTLRTRKGRPPQKKKWWKGMDLKWSWKFIVGFFSFLPFWGLVYMDFYLFGDYYITIWISISEMLRKKISVCWVTWVTIRGDYSSNDISNLMPQTITVFN